MNPRVTGGPAAGAAPPAGRDPDRRTGAAADRRTPAGVVVVTDRRQARAPLPTVVAAAVAGGARWVLLREKDLPRAERAALAAELRQVLAPAGGRLLVAGPEPLAGDGVHLAASDPLPGWARATSGRVAGPAVGRSCHDAAELDRLTVEDYGTVSPVFPTVSKPGHGPALGAAGLARLCRRAGRPVLALGGVTTPAQVATCRTAGAAGVAVMGAVMRAADPAALVASLRAAWSQASPPRAVAQGRVA